MCVSSTQPVFLEQSSSVQFQCCVLATQWLYSSRCRYTPEGGGSGRIKFVPVMQHKYMSILQRKHFAISSRRPKLPTCFELSEN